MVNYISEFKLELNKIEKLIETPELMRQLAIQTLKSVSHESSLSNTARKIIENGAAALEHISDDSIEDNYQTIYNQICVLAVSALSAKLEKFFINYGNYHWKQIKPAAKNADIKFTLSELAQYGFNIKSNIAQLIKEKDSGISFQDLKSTKRAFETYLGKVIAISSKNTERTVVFYQQCRHTLVHTGGKVDNTFIERVNILKANLRTYIEGDEIKLDKKDWANIKKEFSALLEEIVSI